MNTYKYICSLIHIFFSSEKYMTFFQKIGSTQKPNCSEKYGVNPTRYELWVGSDSGKILLLDLMQVSSLDHV